MTFLTNELNINIKGLLVLSQIIKTRFMINNQQYCEYNDKMCKGKT